MNLFFTRGCGFVRCLAVLGIVGAGMLANLNAKQFTEDFQTAVQTWYEFEPGEEFAIEGSRYNIPSINQVKYYGNVPEYLSRTQGSTNSLGFRFSWDRRGNNHVDFVPVEKKDFRGKLEQIAMWIWGGNYTHEVFAMFRNPEGLMVGANFGKLNYFGWKKRNAYVPNEANQRSKDVSGEDYYYFDRFRLVADPKGKVNHLYVFLDQMQVSEQFNFVRYDGSDLEEIIKTELGTGSRENAAVNGETEATDAPATQ